MAVSFKCSNCICEIVSELNHAPVRRPAAIRYMPLEGMPRKTGVDAHIGEIDGLGTIGQPR